MTVSGDKIFIGIDNGVSGSVAILDQTGAVLAYFRTPVFETLSYQKNASRIHRIATQLLENRLREFVPRGTEGHILVERPMVMPARFAATVSALRAYEATLITAERVLPHFACETIDSRSWQKEMLGEGHKGPQLKVASAQRGGELFPGQKPMIASLKEADALLIAEWGRRHR